MNKENSYTDYKSHEQKCRSIILTHISNLRINKQNINVNKSKVTNKTIKAVNCIIIIQIKFNRSFNLRLKSNYMHYASTRLCQSNFLRHFRFTSILFYFICLDTNNSGLKVPSH